MKNRWRLGKAITHNIIGNDVCISGRDVCCGSGAGH